jgi:hypothetical protein
MFPVLDEDCPLASDAPSQAVTEQPSKSSQSVYEDAPALMPDDEDQDWDIEQTETVQNGDLKQDAWSDLLNKHCVKQEWKQAKRRAERV